jgi:hypothetical protein
MTEYPNQQSGQDCGTQRNPAPQPHGPGECKGLTQPTPPDLTTPQCDPPDASCKCPPPPTSTSDCLEDLIASQATQVAAGEKAKAFQTELGALLTAAKAAAQAYTSSKYAAQLKLWEQQDRDIVELIRKLVCAVPCWRCIIECYVCPLINDVIYAERRLYNDQLYDKVYDLYDLRYWHERNRDAQQRQLERIKGVLAAWQNPAATLDKILSDDAKLISDANKTIGTDAAKTVYDVFLKLVPMHLTIAPPSTKSQTGIDVKFTQFCGCDKGTLDDCCGPDVGKLSVRQRLVGPQPFLVDPNDYFGIICCLVEKRYVVVKDAYADADAQYQRVDKEITRYTTLIAGRLDPKAFETEAKRLIPPVVECCGTALKNDSSAPAAN